MTIAYEFEEVPDFLKAVRAEKVRNLFYSPTLTITEEKQPGPEGQPPVSISVCAPSISLTCESGDRSRVLECLVRLDKAIIQSQNDIGEIEGMLIDEMDDLKERMRKFYPDAAILKGKLKVYSG
jgi:hypothetical protein